MCEEKKGDIDEQMRYMAKLIQWKFGEKAFVLIISEFDDFKVDANYISNIKKEYIPGLLSELKEKLEND